jgi:hypothetical protein
VAPGTVDIAANAPGFSQALDSVTVTSSLISIGAIPAVAPGQAASLPISISDPAPGGGLVVTLTSNDPSIATIDPSVFIPAGQFTPAANPQVTGVLIGTTQILATAPSFAPGTRNVNVSLNLVLTPNPFDVIETNTDNITLNLSAPAPAGGILITLATDNSGVATVPSGVTVPQGQTSTTIPVTGQSVGSTILRANASGVAEATANINVDPAPPINLSSNLVIGDDLQVGTQPSLGAPAPAGNLIVTFTSADPARMLLAPDANTPGTASITRQYNAGSTFAGTIFVQALDDTGTVGIIASAPGYATSTGTVTMVPSGFAWLSASFPTTTFSNVTLVTMRSVRLNPGNLNFVQEQIPRAGLTVNVAVTSSDTNVGTIDGTYTYVGGTVSRVAGSFDPINAGTTDLTVTQPPGFNVPANLNQSITATVTAPLINMADTTVGDDLQVNTFAALAVAPPVPTDVTFTVADPSVAVISTSATTPGGAGITLIGVTGPILGNINIQGLAQGITTITVEAAGYQTRVADVTVTPSGFAFFSSTLSTTTFSPDVGITMRSVRLSPVTGNLAQEQRLRAGFTVDVSVTSSDTNVGTMQSPFQYTGNVSRVVRLFDPLNAGSTDLDLAQPAGFEIPANAPQQIVVTVTAPAINASNVSVGDDLQVGTSVSLAVAPPVPTDVIFTIADPGIALITTNLNAVGSGTLTLPGVTSANFGLQTIQGLQQGSTTMMIEATGYTTRIVDITVDPSGFGWLSANFSTTTFSTDRAVTMRSVRLNPGTLAFMQEQRLRAGLTVDISAASSDTNVGTITSPLQYTGNVSRVNGVFDPLTAGTTELTMTQPAGFEIPANINQTITATVNAPDVFMFGNPIVGRDLQVNQTVTLQVAPPAPTDVTISVSSGTIATITRDGTLEGSASITVPNVTSTFVCNCFIQGRGLGSTLLTAQAAGYNDATSNVTVDPSGFTFPFTSSISTTAGAPNTNVQMRSSRLNPMTLNRVTDQAVRGGLTVSVDMSNSNPTAGVLTVNPLIFPPSTFLQNTQFDPAAAGATVITIQAPPGFSTPSSNQQINVTVNP